MWHCDSDIHLVTWLCHFCVTWLLSHDLSHDNFPLDNIYFRIVFRIGKRIWVKMKFFNVCCLMLTMLNNGWQKENWLLRDQSRLEIIPLNTWQKYVLNLNDRRVQKIRATDQTEKFGPTYLSKPVSNFGPVSIFAPVRATMTTDWLSQELYQDQNYGSEKCGLRTDQFSRSVTGPVQKYLFFKVRTGPTFFYVGPLFWTAVPISGSIIWFGPMIRE